MESTAHDHTKRTAESARNTAARTFERMTTEPVAGLIVRLGIPTVLSMLVTALYNTVSTFYVSYLGTSAVGAMGVAFALQMVIQALGIMVGQGCASQTSRLLGAKEYAKAHETASSALFTSLLLGVLFSVVSLFTLASLLSVMGATDTILPYAVEYAKPVLYAAPFMAASFTLNNILRSEGMAFVGMIGLGIGGILNMAVAPLFIFTFDLGISGAGWATALSQTVSFVILLSFFAGGRGSIRLSPLLVSKSLRTYGTLFRLGMPSLSRNILGAVAASALNLMAGVYGDAAVAAMSIVGRVMMVTSAAMIGIGQGYQPVLGYNWGAKRYDRVLKAADATLAMSTALMTALGLLGFVFAEEVVAFFRTEDPAVVQIGVEALLLQCLVAPFMPVSVVSNMTYQVLGRAGIATFLACLRQGIFFLPLILILPRFFGLYGIESAQPAAELLSFIVCIGFVVRFRREVVHLASDTGAKFHARNPNAQRITTSPICPENLPEKKK